MKKFPILLIAYLFASIAQAQTSTSKPMSFENCLKSIQMVAAQLGVTPINIVETTELRMVRFLTSDGSVLITCSKPDQKQVITVSKN